MVEPRYLLDTNVLSEPARPLPNPQLMRQLDANQDCIATASVVVHELIYGLEKLPPSKKRRHIGEYLDQLLSSSLPIFPYDEEAAKWHAQERARLEKIGRPTSFRDAQIAAIAKVHGLVIVTANVKDFEPLSVEIENWMKST